MIAPAYSSERPTPLDARNAVVDWAAILAGAVLATAIGLILIAFGAGLGLSVASPYDGEGMSPVAYAIAAGLWLLWTQVLSFSIGGYVAARLRTRNGDVSEHEADVRDGLHGALVWGTGVIAAALISFATLGGASATVEDADRGGVVSAVAAVTAEQLDQAAAAEVTETPAAVDETIVERRAEIARKVGIIATFVTAASLLAGAVAAFFAAGVGGDHRDRATHLKFFALRPPVRPGPKSVA